MLQKVGDAIFPVGDAESLYLGKTHPRSWKMTMRDYIALMDHNHSVRHHPHLYMFEWVDNLSPEAQRLLLESPFSPSNLFATSGLGGPVTSRVIAIGAHGAGVPFHFHGPAWNELVYGKKRWFMYPLEQTPAGGYNELRDQSSWFDTNYNLSLETHQPPYECMQYPGDIVYVPEGFYHATVNCGQSVAVAALVPDVTQGSQAHRMQSEGTISLLANSVSAQIAGDQKTSLELLEAAYRQAPQNDLVCYLLGLRNVQVSRLERGIGLLKKSLRLNPMRVSAYRDLAKARGQDGMPKRALRALEVGAEHCPEYPTETCLQLYAMLETLYRQFRRTHQYTMVTRKLQRMRQLYGRTPQGGSQMFPAEWIPSGI